MPAKTPRLEPRVRALATFDQIRAELACVYRDARCNRITPSDGARLASILIAMGRLLELAEIQRKLLALEGQLAARREPLDGFGAFAEVVLAEARETQH
jgi:hypothetical protein